MAILHSKAGQYGKAVASRRLKSIVNWCIGFALGGGLIMGFFAGYFWSRYSLLLVPAALTVGFVVVYTAWRLVDPYLDRLHKERIHHLRGGQIEAYVAWMLKNDTDDTWHLFNSVKLEKDSDIDHVLVGPGNVYCISTKSHRGLFTGTSDGLLHNNQPTDFAQQALRQTMNLRTRLQAIMGADAPWVQPLLAVPFGFVDGERRGACGGKVWVVHQENIVEQLTGDNIPRRLDKRTVERVVRAIEILSANSAEVYQRPKT